MMEKASLKRLIARSFRDSEVLLIHGRYAGAIYLGGYAIELMLKHQVCVFLEFGEGYPETPEEFNRVLKAAGRHSLLDGAIRHIRDLRVHDLSRLLEYSGEAVKMIRDYHSEWMLVSRWNIGLRYDASVVQKHKAEKFNKAAAILLRAFLRGG